MAASAFIIFHCSSKDLQQRAGFDGWVLLLREEFDTEDQAWPQERLRLGGMAKRKMRRLEAGGVELDMLQLVTSCHLLLEPPAEDIEEERIWCIEFFKGKMYDFVADDRELIERLERFQEELLCSARLATSRQNALRMSHSSTQALDATIGSLASARPSGDPSSPDPFTRSHVGGRSHDSGGGEADEAWSELGEEVPSARDESFPSHQRKGHASPMSAAELATALDLRDLEGSAQRFGAGAFIPILPGIGSDTPSAMREGLATLPDSTVRGGLGGWAC